MCDLPNAESTNHPRLVIRRSSEARRCAARATDPLLHRWATPHHNRRGPGGRRVLRIEAAPTRLSLELAVRLIHLGLHPRGNILRRPREVLKVDCEESSTMRSAPIRLVVIVERNLDSRRICWIRDKTPSPREPRRPPRTSPHAPLPANHPNPSRARHLSFHRRLAAPREPLSTHRELAHITHNLEHLLDTAIKRAQYYPQRCVDNLPLPHQR